MIRRHRFALALLAVLAAILFIAPLAKREVFQFRDHSDYFQPMRWFTAQELSAGRLPLWNPYSASGEPWLANPQTGVFYPPAWLFLAMPFETAYMLYLLLHVVLLGWGAYALFVRSGSSGAALAGAVAILFSGPVLSLMDVSSNLAALAWIPLALWCASEGAWKRGGVVLAMAFLAGEPLLAAVAALLYVIVRRHRDIIGTAAIAFGLSAIQVLPFIEMIRGTDRTGGMDPSQILIDSMPFVDWVHVVIPAYIYHKAYGQMYVPAVYAGLSVTLLAIVGLTTLRKRRDLLGWIALLVATAFIANGPMFLTKLPVTLLRYPARLLPLAVLALGALAAAGWDRLRIDKRWLDLVVVLVIVGDLLPRVMPLLFTGPFHRDVVPYAESIGAKHKILRVGQDEMKRLESIGGYLNLYDHRYDSFTGAPLMTKAYLDVYTALQTSPSRERLDAAAIGYVITARELPPAFTRVARAWSMSAYAVPQPRSMAASIAASGVTPLTWEMDTSHARVIVDRAEPSVVTIAQQDAPGWSVTIDGKPAKKRLFFDVFRAVDVPGGRHEIIWTYHPRSFFFGAIMTLVTLIALTLSVFVKRAR